MVEIRSIINDINNIKFNQKNMKKKVKKERVIKEKYQSVKSRALILLQQRNDLTISKLAELLNVAEGHAQIALGSLRKMGIKVWPAKGPGTFLRIASSQSEIAKYIAYRRNRFAPTAHRMYVTEFEAGQQFPELAEKSKELLGLLSSTKQDEVSNTTNRSN